MKIIKNYISDETVWADAPELIEARRQEILELYPQVGIGVARRLIEKKSF